MRSNAPRRLGQLVARHAMLQNDAGEVWFVFHQLVHDLLYQPGLLASDCTSGREGYSVTSRHKAPMRA